MISHDQPRVSQNKWLLANQGYLMNLDDIWNLSKPPIWFPVARDAGMPQELEPQPSHNLNIHGNMSTSPAGQALFTGVWGINSWLLRLSSYLFQSECPWVHGSTGSCLLSHYLSWPTINQINPLPCVLVSTLQQVKHSIHVFMPHTIESWDERMPFQNPLIPALPKLTNRNSTLTRKSLEWKQHPWPARRRKVVWWCLLR